MKRKNFYKTRLLYLGIAYILLAPALPQLFGIKTVLIREWEMFKVVGHGIVHIEAFDSGTGDWIDISDVPGFKMAFPDQDQASKFVERLRAKYPGAKVQSQLSTAKGWQDIVID